MNASYLSVALLSSLCAVTPAKTSPTLTSPRNAWRLHTSSLVCYRLHNGIENEIEQDEDDNPTQKVIGKPVTRAQAAQMTFDVFQTTLFKADSKAGYDTPFGDVSTTDPNFKAIVALARHHIATGTLEDNQLVFHPKEAPSRYDLAQAMDNLLKELKPASLEALLIKDYPMPMDMPQSAPAYNAVQKMLKLHVLRPFTDGYFRGKRPTTDEEVAYSLARVRELAGSKSVPKKSATNPVNSKPTK